MLSFNLCIQIFLCPLALKEYWFLPGVVCRGTGWGVTRLSKVCERVLQAVSWMYTVMLLWCWLENLKKSKQRLLVARFLPTALEYATESAAKGFTNMTFKLLHIIWVIHGTIQKWSKMYLSLPSDFCTIFLEFSWVTLEKAWLCLSMWSWGFTILCTFFFVSSQNQFLHSKYWRYWWPNGSPLTCFI